MLYLNIGWGVYSGAQDGLAVPAPLVKLVTLLLNDTNIILEYIAVIPHYLVNNYARLP